MEKVIANLRAIPNTPIGLPLDLLKQCEVRVTYY